MTVSRVISFFFIVTLGYACQTDLEKGKLADKYYEEGKYEKAIKLYQELAKKDSIKAQYDVGFMYANAQGVEQDYEKAFEWYQKAAEKGHSTAQNNLGRVYYENNFGAEKNQEEAISGFVKLLHKEINLP